MRPDRRDKSQRSIYNLHLCPPFSTPVETTQLKERNKTSTFSFIDSMRLCESLMCDKCVWVCTSALFVAQHRDDIPPSRRSVHDNLTQRGQWGGRQTSSRLKINSVIFVRNTPVIIDRAAHNTHNNCTLSACVFVLSSHTTTIITKLLQFPRSPLTHRRES